MSQGVNQWVSLFQQVNKSHEYSLVILYVIFIDIMGLFVIFVVG